MKGTLKSIALVAAGFIAGGLVCSSTDTDDEESPDGIEVVTESEDKGPVSEDPEPSSGGTDPIPEAAGEGVDGAPEASVGD